MAQDTSSGSLQEAQKFLLQQIQSDTTVGTPTHNAFEIENPTTGVCYAFVVKDEHIFVYNTSPGKGNRLFDQAGPGVKPFPGGAATAQDCLTDVYNKSMRGEGGFIFIGYIDPKTFEPLNG